MRYSDLSLGRRSLQRCSPRFVACVAETSTEFCFRLSRLSMFMQHSASSRETLLSQNTVGLVDKGQPSL
jgi:hypothetical protein